MIEKPKTPEWILRRGPTTDLAWPSPCPACGVWTWWALVAGFLARFDLGGLDLAGEATARLLGRETYNAIPVGRRVVIAHRGMIELLAPRRCPVVVGHVCGSTLGGTENTMQRRVTKALPSEPEF